MSGMIIRSPILPSIKTPKPPDLDLIENFDPGLFAAMAEPTPGIDRDNWKLNSIAFWHLECVFTTPYMDLFATQDNRQTHRFCSTGPGDWQHPDLIAKSAYDLVWSVNALCMQILRFLQYRKCF
jgi:hypothetical protein